MSDLVKRLREKASGDWPMWVPLADDAADRIEALEAALRLTEDALNGIRDDMLDDRENIPTAYLIEAVAAGIRAALTSEPQKA